MQKYKNKKQKIYKLNTNYIYICKQKHTKYIIYKKQKHKMQILSN